MILCSLSHGEGIKLAVVKYKAFFDELSAPFTESYGSLTETPKLRSTCNVCGLSIYSQIVE